MSRTSATDPLVTLSDTFWATRLEQLRTHGLSVLGERLERHGVMAAWSRLGSSPAERPERRGLWFTDSDLFKWMEACWRAGRSDLAEIHAANVLSHQQPDGYLNSYYGVAGGPERYSDLANSHEWYCGGHFIEAAIAHAEMTGNSHLVEAACRYADHLCDTFGPGRDERIDAHPEIELAMARLARHTGNDRYLQFARWVIESTIDLDHPVLAGHAVRAIYLASGVAEVALAGDDPRYRAAAGSLFNQMVRRHSYPTGAVGGRWLGEAVGRPYELSDESSYSESCAAVAALQFSQRMWELTRAPECLDHLEVVLYNAVAGGVGADGESWFYSQPHACSTDAEANPWASPLDFQASVLLEWFPPHRHTWFDVTCCPTNLARAFAGVTMSVAEVAADGSLLIHLPIACRIETDHWDVEIRGQYPWAGNIEVVVHRSPVAGRIAMRVPSWADGKGHRDITATHSLHLDINAEWWEADPRVTGARGASFIRRGPIVYCVEVAADAGFDLRSIVVDASRRFDERDAPMLAGGVTVVGVWGSTLSVDGPLYRRRGDGGLPTGQVELTAVPYAARSNRGLQQMTILMRH